MSEAEKVRSQRPIMRAPLSVPTQSVRSLIPCAVLIALMIALGATLNSQQFPGAPSLPGDLTDVELTTPFTVAELKGTIYSSRKQRLPEAQFLLDRGNGTSIGAS